MFSEMNSMVDEVRQIEGKVLEISRLQEIFTEKVLVQVHVTTLYLENDDLYLYVTNWLPMNVTTYTRQMSDMIG